MHVDFHLHVPSEMSKLSGKNLIFYAALIAILSYRLFTIYQAGMVSVMFNQLMPDKVTNWGNPNILMRVSSPAHKRRNFANMTELINQTISEQ